MSKSDRLAKLRRVLQLHTNWLTVRLLGEDAISKEELAELKEYGKLPLGDEVGLAEKSFMLGRLRAILKSSEYKKLDYEKLEKLVNEPDPKLTPLEEMAVQEAKLHAATYVKKLTDDIAAGAFDRFGESLSETLTEATIKEVIKDKTALAVKEKQSYQKLASNITKELKTSWHRDWRMVAETELHRSKMRGTAMAIVNQVDIYSNSDGIESEVSIIPNPETCEDCSHHYLDSSGNPKVFKLRELLTKGSNGEKEVNHKRSGGKHVGWKTTLPPLHPRCGCRLVYVPPGMSWKAGKLQITDEAAYKESISKAVDKGSLSPTVKPPGPKSTQNSDSPAAAKPASMPGLPAPGNSPGPGRPKTDPFADTVKQDDKVDCPFGGGDECKKNGGNGAKTHDPNGEIMKAHREAMARGAKPEDPEAAQQAASQLVEEAKSWSKQGPDQQTVLSHLKEGEIGHIKQLSQDEGGINPSFRVSIIGNGRGLMKGDVDRHPLAAEVGKFVRADGAEHWLFSEGIGTVPWNSNTTREVAASKLFNSVGLGDMCPATTQRVHNGKAHSVQHWVEDTQTASVHIAEKHGKNSSISDFIKGSPDPENMKEQLNTIVAADVLMNNNDRHAGNFIVSEDGSKVRAIDHGVSFGVGLQGYKSTIHLKMQQAGYKVKLPEAMQEKLKNMSLGDFKRGVGGHVEDWAVGQTFMRAQYMLHLQETEGHLDYKHFEGSQILATGDHRMDDRLWLGNHSRSEDEKKKLYNAMQDERQLSFQKFEDFCMDWLDNVSEDPSHPHHESAKELKELGVFMEPGGGHNAYKYRKSGKHKEYEKKIRQQRETVNTLVSTRGSLIPERDSRGIVSQLDIGTRPGAGDNISGATNPAQAIENTKQEKFGKDEEATKKSLYILFPDKPLGA